MASRGCSDIVKGYLIVGLLLVGIVACRPQFPTIENDGAVYELSCAILDQDELDPGTRFEFDSGEPGMNIVSVDSSDAVAWRSETPGSDDFSCQSVRWRIVYSVDLTNQERAQIERTFEP
jgi:hypothetical protein